MSRRPYLVMFVFAFTLGAIFTYAFLRSRAPGEVRDSLRLRNDLAYAIASGRLDKVEAILAEGMEEDRARVIRIIAEHGLRVPEEMILEYADDPSEAVREAVRLYRERTEAEKTGGPDIPARGDTEDTTFHGAPKRTRTAPRKG